MNYPVEIHGIRSTRTAAAVHFLEWVLSLESVGRVAESDRTALGAARVFQNAIEGHKEAVALCALAGVTFK